MNRRKSNEKMKRYRCSAQFIDRMSNYGGLPQVLKGLPDHAEDSFKIKLHNDTARSGRINDMDIALKVLEKYLTDKSLINSSSVIRDKSYERK